MGMGGMAVRAGRRGGLKMQLRNEARRCFINRPRTTDQFHALPRTNPTHEVIDSSLKQSAGALA